MPNTTQNDYLLTIVQHNYCPDCMWLKGKITDVYHASSLMRGEDSKNWRINVISPLWDRDKRALDFPVGFESIDVPAVKLEVDGKIAVASQNPALIDALLLKVKSMLANREPNHHIKEQMEEVAREWKDSDAPVSCQVRPEVFVRRA